MAEKLWGYSPCGIFGYSHLLGGYAGGQAEYARVPFADVGRIKVPDDLGDDRCCSCRTSSPPGTWPRTMCGIQPGDVVAVWGCGPVGQFAIKSAYLLGAEKVIAHRPVPVPLAHRRRARRRRDDQLRRVGRPRGAERDDRRTRTGCTASMRSVWKAHAPGPAGAYDRVKTAMMLETDRPVALRQAILRVPQRRHGLGGRRLRRLHRQVPDGRHREPLADDQVGPDATCTATCVRCSNASSGGEIDPSFVITHRLRLDEGRRVTRCSTTNRTSA